jgi:drug/metabolite transporter (DMT)-like permease
MTKSRLALPIFIAILAVSTASIFIRLAQKDAPSLVIAAVRLTLASLILVPATFSSAANRAQLKSLTRRDWILAILSGLFLSVHFASWITSLEYTTVVASVVLVSTGPLWVALLSPLFLREFPSRWVWIGMCLALVGGLIVGLSDSCAVSGLTLACPPLSDLLAGSAFLGNFLALLGALTVAGYLMIGRRLRAKVDLVPYVFVIYSVAAIALIGYMLLAGQTPFGYPQLTYLWLLCLALIPQLIGHSTYNWALKYLPASMVVVTTLVEPFGAAILAFVILREIPSLPVVGGGALILIGVFLAMRPNETQV